MKTEMSKIDSWLPRYYKGYDLDELLQKDELSKEEKLLICEAEDIYYKKHGEEVRKQTDEIIEKNKKAGIIIAAGSYRPGIENIRLLNPKRTES